MGYSSKKKTILSVIATTVIVVFIIGALIFSDSLQGNIIKVSNEDFELFKNQPYSLQIIKNCTNEMRCTVNAMQSIADSRRGVKATHGRRPRSRSTRPRLTLTVSTTGLTVRKADGNSVSF